SNVLCLLLSLIALASVAHIWVVCAPAQNLDSLRSTVRPESSTSAPKFDLFDYEKDRLNALDNTSRVLLTVGGVFAILLGFGSWKALEEQRHSAKEALQLQIDQSDRRFEQAMEDHAKKIQKTLEDVGSLRDEVRQDFPMFGRMRRNFAGILIDL